VTDDIDFGHLGHAREIVIALKFAGDDFVERTLVNVERRQAVAARPSCERSKINCSFELI
jgi:hypothetical protein